LSRISNDCNVVPSTPEFLGTLIEDVHAVVTQRPGEVNMGRFIDKVKQLQWHDHRYYRQCRINQTLHLASAISLLVAYVMLFIDPAVSGLIWDSPVALLRGQRSAAIETPAAPLGDA
jgi:hypothetical protein